MCFLLFVLFFPQMHCKWPPTTKQACCHALTRLARVLGLQGTPHFHCNGSSDGKACQARKYDIREHVAVRLAFITLLRDGREGATQAHKQHQGTQ